MNHQAFRQVMEARIGKIRSVLDSKGREYSTEDDRLHNFKRSSGFRGDRTPAQVCGDFWLKHVTSIFDLVDRLAVGETVPVAVLDEKITDAVNYLILLEAILLEGGRPS